MSGEHVPVYPSRLRFRATLQQRIAETAIEVSHAVVRGQDHSEYLVNQTHALFRANAGVGLTTWRPSSPAPEEQLKVVVAGAPPLTVEQALLARPFAATHPGFLAMARVGTTHAIRVSDHTNLRRFWTTESFWRMHGHSDGRYPASAVLFAMQERQIFLGIHRHDRDFSDAEIVALASLQRALAVALAFRASLDDNIRLLQRTFSPSCGEAESVADRRRPNLAAAARLCSDYAPTRREGEVLSLAAEGWTNHQIGRRLGITERTVRKHLTSVYDKAGVRGRAAAAAWWQRLND